jgi:DNA-binding CsgD family transcriptional regulator
MTGDSGPTRTKSDSPSSPPAIGAVRTDTLLRFYTSAIEALTPLSAFGTSFAAAVSEIIRAEQVLMLVAPRTILRRGSTRKVRERLYAFDYTPATDAAAKVHELMYSTQDGVIDELEILSELRARGVIHGEPRMMLWEVLASTPDCHASIHLLNYRREFDVSQIDGFDALLPHMQSLSRAGLQTWFAQNATHFTFVDLCEHAGQRFSLTRREVDVLRTALLGTIEDAAARLSVSFDTVHSHLSHIYKKVGVKNRYELLAKIIPTEPEV